MHNEFRNERGLSYRNIIKTGTDMVIILMASSWNFYEFLVFKNYKRIMNMVYI